MPATPQPAALPPDAPAAPGGEFAAPHVAPRGEAAPPAVAPRGASGPATAPQGGSAQSARSRRPRNPRGEGERLRRQLLDATVEVLGEVGDADKVSVRAIARCAGVSPTALYLQFADRDALVDAAVDAGFTAFNAVLAEAATGPGSPLERLEAMGVAYLRFAAGRQALYEVLFAARRPLLERHGTPRQRGFDGLVALLRQVDTTLDPDAARQLALLIWSSLHGYAMLRVARPHFDWPDAETYIRRLLTAHHLSA